MSDLPGISSRPTDPPLATPRAAVVVGSLTVVLTAVCLVLSALTNDPQDDVAGNLVGLAAALSFSAVGFLVVRRQPRNALGWVLLASAPCVILSQIGGTYAVIDYRLHGGALPLGWLAVSLGEMWVPWIMLLGLPILLFPTGTVPSPRWWWTLWLYLGSGCLATLGSLADGVVVGLRRHVHILLDGSPSSSGHSVLTTVAGGFLLLAALVALGLTVAWIVRLVLSYRGAAGDRRQQLKWLTAGAIVTVGVFVGSFLAPANTSSGTVVNDFLLPFGIAALPIGMGVGILKYHLYEIDRIISRTLSYAIVTGLLVGVYVGLVTLASRVLPFSSPLGVAASTLAAVALFNPLRRRVQRVVDRRFNRARYDAETTVSVFAQRLRDDIDLEAVSAEFVGAVEAAVEPVHVALWLRETA
jgi:hypothetical protein